MVRRILLILIGGAVALLLVLIGIAAVIFWPLITSAHSTSSGAVTSTPTTTALDTTATPTSKRGIAQVLKQYGPDIKTQIAQDLKLTPEQLTTQLRTGRTLSQIATAQGISTSQLQAIVTNAVEIGLKPAVNDEMITQKQLDKLAKRYGNNPSLLDKLLGGKGAKTPTATPTIAPQQ